MKTLLEASCAWLGNLLPCAIRISAPCHRQTAVSAVPFLPFSIFHLPSSPFRSPPPPSDGERRQATENDQFSRFFRFAKRWRPATKRRNKSNLPKKGEKRRTNQSVETPEFQKIARQKASKGEKGEQCRAKANDLPLPALAANKRTIKRTNADCPHFARRHSQADKRGPSATNRDKDAPTTPLDPPIFAPIESPLLRCRFLSSKKFFFSAKRQQAVPSEIKRYKATQPSAIWGFASPTSIQCPIPHFLAPATRQAKSIGVERKRTISPIPSVPSQCVLWLCGESLSAIRNSQSYHPSFFIPAGWT